MKEIFYLIFSLLATAFGGELILTNHELFLEFPSSFKEYSHPLYADLSTLTEATPATLSVDPSKVTNVRGKNVYNSPLSSKIKYYFQLPSIPREGSDLYNRIIRRFKKQNSQRKDWKLPDSPIVYCSFAFQDVEPTINDNQNNNNNINDIDNNDNNNNDNNNNVNNINGKMKNISIRKHRLYLDPKNFFPTICYDSTDVTKEVVNRHLALGAAVVVLWKFLFNAPNIHTRQLILDKASRTVTDVLHETLSNFNEDLAFPILKKPEKSAFRDSTSTAYKIDLTSLQDCIRTVNIYHSKEEFREGLIEKCGALSALYLECGKNNDCRKAVETGIAIEQSKEGEKEQRKEQRKEQSKDEEEQKKGEEKEQKQDKKGEKKRKNKRKTEVEELGTIEPPKVKPKQHFSDLYRNNLIEHLNYPSSPDFMYRLLSQQSNIVIKSPSDEIKTFLQTVHNVLDPVIETGVLNEESNSLTVENIRSFDASFDLTQEKLSCYGVTNLYEFCYGKDPPHKFVMDCENSQATNGNTNENNANLNDNSDNTNKNKHRSRRELFLDLDIAKTKDIDLLEALSSGVNNMNVESNDDTVDNKEIAELEDAVKTNPPEIDYTLVPGFDKSLIEPNPADESAPSTKSRSYVFAFNFFLPNPGGAVALGYSQVYNLGSNRNPGQEEVMGISCNALARKLKVAGLIDKTITIDYLRSDGTVSFEWSHLIAHSFGGPYIPNCKYTNYWIGSTPSLKWGGLRFVSKYGIDENKDYFSNRNDHCPQSPYNLAFATYEANTHSILLKNFFKHLYFLKKRPSLRVEWGPNCRAILPFWIADHINYQITLETIIPTPTSTENNNNPDQMNEEPVSALNPDSELVPTISKINLLSTYTPTQLELWFNAALLYFRPGYLAYEQRNPTPNPQSNDDLAVDSQPFSLHSFHMQREANNALTALPRPSILEAIPSLANTFLAQIDFHKFNFSVVDILFENLYTRPVLQFRGGFDLDSLPLFSKLSLQGHVNLQVSFWPWESPDYSPNAFSVSFAYTTTLNLFNIFQLDQVSVYIAFIPHSDSRSTFSTAATVSGVFSFPFISTPPIYLSTTFFEGSSDYSVYGRMDNWYEPFGVKGVFLQDISLYLRVGRQDFMNLNAKWYLGTKPNSTSLANTTSVSFIGFISDDQFAVKGQLLNANFQDLSAFYQETHGSSLNSDIAITIQELTISIASHATFLNGAAVPQGVAFKALFNIGPVSNILVTGQFNEKGIQLFGTTPTIPSSLTGGFVALYNPTVFLQISNDDNIPSEFFIGANATFAGSVSMAAFIYFQSNPDAAMLGAVAENVNLGSILPFVTNTPFDITFSEILVMVTDGVAIPANIKALVSKYPAFAVVPPGEGVTIIAELSSIPFVTDLLRLQSAKAYLSYVMSTTSTKLIIIVALNSDLNVNSNSGTSPSSLPSSSTSTTVTANGFFQSAQIRITVEFEPLFLISCNYLMAVNLPGSGTPALFDAFLTVDEFTAELGASLSNPNPKIPAWPNAMGIPGFDIYNLALAIGFSIDTGFPDLMGFSGMFELPVNGQIREVDVTVLVGADDQFGLKIETSNVTASLGVAFLAMLVSKVANVDISFIINISEVLSYIEIQYLLVYISDGISIGSINLPAGAHFKLDADLFGYPVAEFEGTAAIGQGAASFTGTLSEFQLGPAKVTAFNDNSTGPHMSFQISSSQQSLYLNGQIQLFDGAVALGIDMTLSPNTLDAVFELKLLPGLGIVLAIHASDFVHPSSAQFSVSGSVDLGDLSQLFSKVAQQCLDGALHIANDVIGAYNSARETAFNAINSFSQAWSDAQQAQIIAQQAQVAIADAAASIVSAANNLVDIASQSIDYAKDEAVALINTAQQVAAAAIIAAIQAKEAVIAYYTEAIHDAEAILNALKDAAQSAWNAVSSIFDYHVAHEMSLNVSSSQLNSIAPSPNINPQLRHLREHIIRLAALSSLDSSPSLSRHRKISLKDFFSDLGGESIAEAESILNSLRAAYNDALNAAEQAIQAASSLGPILKLAAELEGEALESFAEALKNTAEVGLNSAQILGQTWIETAENEYNLAKSATTQAFTQLSNTISLVSSEVEAVASEVESVLSSVTSFISNLVSNPDEILKFDYVHVHADLNDIANNEKIEIEMQGMIFSIPFHVIIPIDLRPILSLEAAAISTAKQGVSALETGLAQVLNDIGVTEICSVL